MATVVIASSLARWLTPTPTSGAAEKSCSVAGGTIRDALESLFAEYPVLRGYITDERGAMRHHVVAFINGSAIRDKETLSDEVPADAEVYVFQALSGG
jgi:molybdopterin synthase sulfur carrier subunit